MTEPLSLLDLILGASITVQIVMALLVLASFVSWVMIFQRWIYYARVAQEISDFEEQFWSGHDLRTIYRDVSAQEAEGLTGIERAFVQGFKEFQRLSRQRGTEPEAVMEGVQRAVRVAVSREEDNLARHLPFLATVGSTSPYVGLFGTVWGIMNAFRNLANVSQATLSAVAPGISEALIATAMGLFAAIPAVIAYNRFAARVDSLLKRYETFSEEFVAIIHRAVHTPRAREES